MAKKRMTQAEAQKKAMKEALASGPKPDKVYRLNVPYAFTQDVPERGYKKGDKIMNWSKRDGQKALEEGLIEPSKL